MLLLIRAVSPQASFLTNLRLGLTAPSLSPAALESINLAASRSFCTRIIGKERPDERLDIISASTMANGSCIEYRHPEVCDSIRT